MSSLNEIALLILDADGLSADMFGEVTGARGEEFTPELLEALEPFLRYAKNRMRLSCLGSATPHISQLPAKKRIQVGEHEIFIPFYGILLDGEELPEDKRCVYPMPEDAPTKWSVYINDHRNALIKVDFSMDAFGKALEHIRTLPEFSELYTFLTGPNAENTHCDRCCPCFAEGATPCEPCRERMEAKE